MGTYMSTLDESNQQASGSEFQNKNQCPKCKGIGLMNTPYIVCNNCNGKKCYKCNELGYTQAAWSECNKCYGTGTLGEISRPVSS